MTKRTKVGLAIGAALVLVAGLGAVGAIAATNALSPREESKAIIEDAAGQLGVEPDALSGALKQALENRIDEAVEAGRLTEAQANELKQRIGSDEFPLFGPGVFRGHGFGGHGFGHAGHGEAFAAAASYLGLTEAELREQLGDQTLAEIAKEKGKSVSGLVQAMVAAKEKAIDEAVADGTLTEEQAEQLKANLQDRIESFVNGEFQNRGFGLGRPWFGRHAASPNGPPFFDGPRA
jgi:polyhydroxyalkanoate synthesis regulator phasin